MVAAELFTASQLLIFWWNCSGGWLLSSVSDPHMLNADPDPDPDPGLWLNTDPGSGSRIPVPNPTPAKKNIFKCSFF